MSYLVLCTFDLENADSSDYIEAYAALEEIGLFKEVEADNGSTVTLPNTVTLGKFEGTSAKSVQNEVLERIKGKFNTLRLKSKIFITASSGWSWKQSKTS